MTISPAWTFSPEWAPTGFGGTLTIIVKGTSNDQATDPQSLIYKINQITSAANAAGKGYVVAVTNRVAVIVQEA